MQRKQQGNGKEEMRKGGRNRKKEMDKRTL